MTNTGYCNATATTSLFTDDFNAYTDGALGGQGLWLPVSTNASNVTIQSLVAYEQKGVKLYATTSYQADVYASTTFATTSVGTTTFNTIFYARVDQPASNFEVDFGWIHAGTQPVPSWLLERYAGIQFNNDGNVYGYPRVGYGGQTLIDTYATGTFNKINVKTEVNGTGYTRWRWAVQVNDGAWKYIEQSFSALGTIIQNAVFVEIYGGGATGTAYFDLFGDGTIPPLPPTATTTSYVSIQPTYPTDCVFNHNVLATSTAYGLIYNPTSSERTFNKINIGLKDYLTGFYYSVASSTINLPPATGISYTAQMLIGSSTYYLDYALWDTNNNFLTFDRCVTSIGSAEATGTIPFIPEPEYPTLTDCSGLGVTDTLLCNIENFFKGLFFPSGEKITELKNNLDQIKQRFPFSYINLMSAFFTSLDTEQTDEIVVSVWNATTSVDFSTFTATSTSYGGESKTLLDRIRNFFAIFIFILFGAWAISYFNRIF